MTLTRSLFCVLQGIFQFSASSAVRGHTCWENDGIIDKYQLPPDITAGQIPLWFHPGNLTPLATPIGSCCVTSFEENAIKETPHRFAFCGHEGRGLAMTLTRSLFCVLQGIFQFSASSAVRGHTCWENDGIIDKYQLPPDITAGQIPLWFHPGNLTPLATPIGSCCVTSFEENAIKETPHRFAFCGHEGRGLAMTLTRSLFCVLQGIFQFSASSAVRGHTCWENDGIIDNDLLGAGVGLLCVPAVIGSLLCAVTSTCHTAVEVLGSTLLPLGTESCWKDSPVGSKCLRLRWRQRPSCVITCYDLGSVDSFRTRALVAHEPLWARTTSPSWSGASGCVDGRD
ncbi:hypothetical protein MRX96_001741 [Rhipicephalus microplus]